MSWGYWGGYTYVSKATKMRNAEKAKAKLMKDAQKAGGQIEPVTITGSKIAKTWWGKSWMENLERYADYENRLPRGRSYARNGSVLDLKISPNTIAAMVAGSRSAPYKITITIKSLDPKKEQALMAKSRDSLDSLQALLSGEFPEALKESFFSKEAGVFPAPKEISFACSCPDWASLCKHVAAAMYGVAARLDEKPELFFILRGIKMDQFIGKMIQKTQKALIQKSQKKTDRVITSKARDLSDLFGIEMEETGIPIPFVKAKLKAKIPLKLKRKKESLPTVKTPRKSARKLLKKQGKTR